MRATSDVQRGWAVWVVGLPGSGKTTLAKGIVAHLAGQGVDAVHFAMDSRRAQYTPNPEYTPEERERAYAMFVEDAASMVGRGENVVMDGSAYRTAMRMVARRRIERFAEIHVHCELDEAMRREGNRPEGLVMADLYAKAMRRKETGEAVPGLGDVVGVDVPFEVDADAELFIDGTHLSKEDVLSTAMHFLDSWLSNE